MQISELINNIIDRFREDKNEDDYIDDYTGYEDDFDISAGIDGATALKYNRNIDAETDFHSVTSKKRTKGEFTAKNSKITPMKSRSKNGSAADNYARVHVLNPKDMESSKEIGNLLINGCVVLINYTGLENKVCQRISDFVYGVIYSIDGRVVMVANNVMVATPSGVDLDGNLDGIINDNISIPSLRR